MKITADDRETPSGIPDLLSRVAGVTLEVCRLKVGDYTINEAVAVERKTAHDFLVSIVDGRLFRQASRLKTHTVNPVFLIEGNPFKTQQAIDPAAIRGAILSLQAIWYLPVIHTRSIEDTVTVLLTIARQDSRRKNVAPLRSGYRPRTIKSRQLFFLQGLPGIGPRIAKRLLDEFDTLSGIIAASVEDLEKIRGVGADTARTLRHFLDS